MSSSIKLPGGFRLNLSKKGLGASVSKKKYGFGIGPNGGRVRGSIPGTGISWNESIPTSKLKKLKEAFFGPSNKDEKENDSKKDFEKEISLNADVVCIMCGKKIVKFANEKAKEEFEKAGNLCYYCRQEVF